MSWEVGAGLLRAGLLNRDSPDLRDLQGADYNETRATYCSSSKCCKKTNANYRGYPVQVGDVFAEKCPNCGSGEFLYWETVSVALAGKIMQKINR